MGASYLLGSLYYSVSIARMILIAELFVSKVGCDVEEEEGFFDGFGKLLHPILIMMIKIDHLLRDAWKLSSFLILLKM